MQALHFRDWVLDCGLNWIKDWHASATMRSQAHIRRNTRLLPIAVALLLVVSLIDPHQGWRILLIGFGLVWLLSILWVRSLAAGLYLKREVRHGSLQVGDYLQERFTLSNNSWAPGLWVEVVDHSTLPDAQASLVTGVGGHSENRWSSERLCARRGLFTLGPTSLRTSDPFGIYSVHLHIPGRRHLLVTPSIIDLPDVEVAAGAGDGEGRSHINIHERSISAAGVRPYMPGDGLREIHWRTSARRGQLFVRRSESLPPINWWIFLDLDQRVQSGRGVAATEEHGIILAASLAERGLCDGRAVGLMAHGKHLLWLPPRIGEGQRWEILKALAVISTGPRTLADLLSHMSSGIGHQSSLIVITPNMDESWIEALYPVMQRGVVPTVFLLDPILQQSSTDTERARVLLANLGAICHRVPRELLERSIARLAHKSRRNEYTFASERSITDRSFHVQKWQVLS